MFLIRIRQLDFGSMPPNRYNNRMRHSSVELKENNRSLCNVILLFFSGKIGYLVPQAATENKWTKFRILCKVARYSVLSAGFYISSYAGSGGFQRVHLREHGVCAGNFRANFGRRCSFWCVFVSKLPREPVAVRQLCFGVAGSLLR